MTVKSGREDLSMKDRRDLLDNDLLWLQGCRPGYEPKLRNGSEIHAINSLIGKVRSCISHDNSWTRAHISKIEYLVLAWRRGGYAEYHRVYHDVYPRPAWL